MTHLSLLGGRKTLGNSYLPIGQTTCLLRQDDATRRLAIASHAVTFSVNNVLVGSAQIIGFEPDYRLLFGQIVRLHHIEIASNMLVLLSLPSQPFTR